MAVAIAALAGVAALEYLVIGLFVVPRLAWLGDERGSRLPFLVRAGAAAFFLGCAATCSTLAVEQMRGGGDAPSLMHLVPYLVQAVGGGAVIWAVFTARLSVQLLERCEIDAEQIRTRLAAVVQHSGDAILTKDSSGIITSWNAAATRIYGYSPAEAIGQAVSLIVPPHRGGEESLILSRVLDGQTVEHYETERRRRDGSIIEMSLTVSPVYGRGAAPVGAAIIGRDITEQSRAARRRMTLAEAGPRLEASLDVGAMAQALVEIVVPRVADACTVDLLDGRGVLERVAVRASDPAVERRLWDGRRAASMHTSPRVRDALASCEASVAERGDDGQASGPAFILPLVTRGAAIGVVGVDSARCRSLDRSLLAELVERGAIGLENARLHAEGAAARAAAQLAAAELEHAQVRFRVAFQEAPIGVALISMQPESRGRFLQVNAALSRITGYARDELERRSMMSLTHPDDVEFAGRLLGRLIDGEASEMFIEKRFTHINGHPIWMQVHGKLVSSDMGEPLYCVAHFQDITDQKRYQGQLQYLADHDALTGLFNRRRLEEELERAAAYVERYRDPAALLVVDLDNFKYYNDTYGHAVGDEVISRTAALLQGHSRATDTVARLGGDEFAIVLAHTDTAGAETFARNLLLQLRSQAVTKVGDRSVYVTASIGIAPIGADVTHTAGQLLTEADVAMYDAKEEGRDRICHVDIQADRSGRIRGRLNWSQRIREALERDRFELWEQPIVTVATGATDRYEVLLRMLGEDDEPIPPGLFLYIAEHFGQIQAIDRWVVDHAIQLLAERRVAGDDRHLEVNLSGATLTDGDVIDFIVDRVQRAPIDPRCLTFEVTETAAIVNIERARQFARRLAGLGCKFALDDFGAGFGSFYYLKHLPFDLIKIDGDFIKKLPTNRTDQLTVQAIVQISRGLGKQTVAEFVGDQETLDLLCTYGVDYAQGYYLGKPQRADPPSTLLAAEVAPEP